ncbi:hypothetical protein EUX98_g7845 [Antrodiella citrinella]|uniref:RING-type domain-containing protein n=1 Tax=Antrodiella citrinella TaxID=2447956 RepID=A0A4V3XHR5_9APHY|nr:hypothetical protein EUX98_g7845 [Antrodiella citrinella]
MQPQCNVCFELMSMQLVMVEDNFVDQTPKISLSCGHVMCTTCDAGLVAPRKCASCRTLMQVFPSAGADGQRGVISLFFQEEDPTNRQPCNAYLAQHLKAMEVQVSQADDSVQESRLQVDRRLELLRAQQVRIQDCNHRLQRRQSELHHWVSLAGHLTEECDEERGKIADLEMKIAARTNGIEHLNQRLDRLDHVAADQAPIAAILGAHAAAPAGHPDQVAPPERDMLQVFAAIQAHGIQVPAASYIVSALREANAFAEARGPAQALPTVQEINAFVQAHTSARAAQNGDAICAPHIVVRAPSPVQHPATVHAPSSVWPRAVICAPAAVQHRAIPAPPAGQDRATVGALTTIVALPAVQAPSAGQDSGVLIPAQAPPVEEACVVIPRRRPNADDDYDNSSHKRRRSL